LTKNRRRNIKVPIFCFAPISNNSILISKYGSLIGPKPFHILTSVGRKSNSPWRLRAIGWLEARYSSHTGRWAS
jgi:hypothetical protein